MSHIPSDTKIYFGPIDTLRTCAFFIVFISHAYFSFFQETELLTRRLAHGEIGVYIFFVLSAFLITFLSLSEYKRTGSFSIVHFFKKRILRIWPVYFLVVGISYAWNIYASQTSFGCTVDFLYFLGNHCMVEGLPDLYGASIIGPLWSVSVEQQFYAVFPIALLVYVVYVKYRHIIRYAVHAGLVSIFVYALYARYTYAHDWSYISYSVVPTLPAFIVGMYLAYGVHKKFSFIEHVHTYRNIYMLSVYAALLGSLYIKFQGALGVSLYVIPIIYATVICIILAIQKREESELSYMQKTLRYLGKISYGLYAYHMIAMVLVQNFIPQAVSFSASLYALGLTIIFSHISYRYFESWFLKFK
jgi:peptidoglycan/LPS O-acetylase OafA/YrhL